MKLIVLQTFLGLLFIAIAIWMILYSVKLERPGSFSFALVIFGVGAYLAFDLLLYLIGVKVDGK
jgi:hypothetical protein